MQPLLSVWLPLLLIFSSFIGVFIGFYLNKRSKWIFPLGIFFGGFLFGGLNADWLGGLELGIILCLLGTFGAFMSSWYHRVFTRIQDKKDQEESK